MANGAFTIGIISEAFLVRRGLVDVLRRGNFKRVLLLGTPPFSIDRFQAECAQSGSMDLVFLDIHPIEDATEGLLPEQVVSVIRTIWPRVKVVAIGTVLELAAHAPLLDGWLETGAASPDQIVAIASAVANGSVDRNSLLHARDVDREAARWRALSPRERQVLTLLGNGSDNLKMAAELTISESSVKGHVSSLLRKYHAENRSELALIARAAGISRYGRNPSFRRD